MKIVVAIIGFLISFHLVFGQVKIMTISEKRITNNGATLLCSYNKSVTDKGDTSKYILLMFRDLQFQMLEEYRTIRFMTTGKSNAEVFQFIKDLKAASARLDGKTELSWDRGMYKISIHDSSDLLYIGEDKKNGYTALNRINVQKLIGWLGEIGFSI